MAVKRTITGTVYFATYPYPQYAKIYATPPLGTEVDTGLTVTAPSGVNYGTFSYEVSELGVWTFRAEAYSGSHVLGGSDTQTINVTAIVAPQPTNLVLSQGPATVGSSVLIGQFDFGVLAATQWARAFYRASGDTIWIDAGIQINPDSSNDGHFQIAGLADDTWEVKVIPYTADGPGTESAIEDIALVSLTAGAGDVVGPSGATDLAVARYDGPTGKLIQDSLVLITDTGVLNIPEVAAPATPSAGTVHVYSKADGKLYIKDDAGLETDLTASASLTVEESDGAPTEASVSKIIVPKNWQTEPAAGQVRLKPRHLLVFEFDGFGEVLTTSIDDAQIDELPWDCTLLKWRLLEASTSPISSTCTMDVLRDTYANYPPVGADSITGTGTKPNLAGPQTKNESSNFTDWTTVNLTAGDVIRVSLDAVTLAEKLRLVFIVEEL